MRNIESVVRETIEGMVAPIPNASVEFKSLDNRTRAVIRFGGKRKALAYGNHAKRSLTSTVKRVTIDLRQALRELGAIDCDRANVWEPARKLAERSAHNRLIAETFRNSGKPVSTASPKPIEEPMPMPTPNTQQTPLSLVKTTPAPEREKRAQLTHDQVLDIAMMLQQCGKVEKLNDGTEIYVYATGWSDDRIREKIGMAATRVNEKVAQIRKNRFAPTVEEHERAKRRAEGGASAEIAELRAENAALRARIEKLEAFAAQFE